MKIIAEKKKEENMVEYILYMYRMEDLLRSYQFNMEEINQYVLSHARVSEEDRAASFQWFQELAKQMKSLGFEKQGHLPFIQQQVDKLANLHWQLLKIDPGYYEVYKKTKPFLLDFITAAADKNPGHEVQIFLNCLYGLLLSRLHGRKVAPELMEASTAFGETLGFLAAAYQEK